MTLTKKGHNKQKKRKKSVIEVRMEPGIAPSQKGDIITLLRRKLNRIDFGYDLCAVVMEP